MQPIRGKGRRKPHYFVDIMNEAAEVTFYIYWRGNGEMSRKIQWRKWENE